MLHKLLELLEKKRQANALINELIVSVLDSHGWQFAVPNPRERAGWEHNCLLCKRPVLRREAQWVSPDGKQRIHNDVSCWMGPR